MLRRASAEDLEHAGELAGEGGEKAGDAPLAVGGRPLGLPGAADEHGAPLVTHSVLKEGREAGDQQGSIIGVCGNHQHRRHVDTARAARNSK